MKKNWIYEYHNAIKNNKVTVGEYIKTVYHILSENIKNGTWLYSHAKADKAINFIENFCHHSEGRNDLIKLELWQKAFIAATFGTLDKETRLRQFTEIVLIVARKNGKTLLAAAIAAYMTYIESEYGTKIYFLAPKIDQANLVFDAFYQIVRSDEELSDITKKRQLDIYVEESNTSIKKIPFSSKRSDGFNPQLVINDEVHAWPGDQGLKQYQAMVSALGARRQPLIITVTTAGYINDGIYDNLFTRGTAFLKGNSEEKGILPIIYAIDDIEKWHDINEVKKANPNLGISVRESFIINYIQKAKISLSDKTEFITKYCNKKQNSSVAWLDYQDVMKCFSAKSINLDDFKNCYCVAGIDLSKTTDLTAVSLVIYKDGKEHILTKFYMPKKRYEIAITEDKIPYNIYLEKGFLEISGSNQVDYKDITEFFYRLVKTYKIRPLKIGYDHWSSTYIVDDLTQYGFHMDDVKQGFNMTPALRNFEATLKDGGYNFGNNDLLAQHLMNVAIQLSINDESMKAVKIEQRMRIDGALSVFDALIVKDKYYSEVGKKLLNGHLTPEDIKN